MKKCYSTDLTDAEWSCLESHVPAPKGRGRPRIHTSRQILDAIFYVLREHFKTVCYGVRTASRKEEISGWYGPFCATRSSAPTLRLRVLKDALKSGCPWRLLPRDFPPWETVYWWFGRWRLDGTFERLNAALREVLRARLGRDPLPSAGIADSQSTKTTGVGGEQRGYDGNKKVRGRKRHLLVDTEGLLLKAKVHSANVPDQDGLRLLLESARGGLSRLSQLWLDAGYEGRGRRWAEEAIGLSVEVVRKPPKPVPEEVAKRWAKEWAKEGKDVDWQRIMPPRGYVALPRRWVVERTFSWLGQNRRMSKDYERQCASAEAFVYAAMIRLMVRRLARA